jgi:hypothetical protein
MQVNQRPTEASGGPIMPGGPDDKDELRPSTRPEGESEEPGQDAPKAKPGLKPFTGGYYWLPRPSRDGVSRSVVTCRDPVSV